MTTTERSMAERANGHTKWVVLDEACERLRSAPRYRETTGRPFVTVSYAQSLDGRIAGVEGRPLALSSAESLALTHALRASHQAILVGVGCVLADNPHLTVRLTAGSNPQPVVVDRDLRCPLSANLLTNNGIRPWIVTTDSHPRENETRNTRPSACASRHAGRHGCGQSHGRRGREGHHELSC